MIDLLIFGLMLMFGLFYAFFLEQIEERWGITSQQTEMTVIGTAATLAFTGLFCIFSELTYWRVWGAFIATGSPIIARRQIKRLVAEMRNRQERIACATPGD